MPITFFVEPERPLEPIAEALDSARVERQQTALATYRAAVEASASGQAKPLSAKQQVELLGAMELLRVDAKEFSADIAVSRRVAQAAGELGDFVARATSLDYEKLTIEAEIAELQKRIVLLTGKTKWASRAKEILTDQRGTLTAWKRCNPRLFGADPAVAASGRPAVDMSGAGTFIEANSGAIIGRPEKPPHGLPYGERTPD